jgi:hypothetical protein
VTVRLGRGKLPSAVLAVVGRGLGHRRATATGPTAHRWPRRTPRSSGRCPDPRAGSCSWWHHYLAAHHRRFHRSRTQWSAGHRNGRTSLSSWRNSSPRTSPATDMTERTQSMAAPPRSGRPVVPRMPRLQYRADRSLQGRTPPTWIGQVRRLRRRRAVQLASAVQPPSTGRATPLTNPLRVGSARNATAAATSSGVANRPMGTCPTMSSSL